MYINAVETGDEHRHYAIETLDGLLDVAEFRRNTRVLLQVCTSRSSNHNKLVFQLVLLSRNVCFWKSFTYSCIYWELTWNLRTLNHEISYSLKYFLLPFIRCLLPLQDYKRFIQNSDKPGHVIFRYIKQVLEEYWHFIILLVCSMTCSYFAKLSCKLCMQLAGFAVPLMLAGPATVSTIPILYVCTWMREVCYWLLVKSHKVVVKTQIFIA